MSATFTFVQNAKTGKTYAARNLDSGFFCRRVVTRRRCKGRSGGVENSLFLELELAALVEIHQAIH